jgi:hypothetical protein
MKIDAHVAGEGVRFGHAVRISAPGADIGSYHKYMSSIGGGYSGPTVVGCVPCCYLDRMSDEKSSLAPILNLEGHIFC